MGKVIKDISDPDLARSHKKGAKVAWMQPCLHEQFGKIMYMWPHFWVYNFRAAERAYNRLRVYEKEILNTEISNSNDRHIYDSKLIEKMYNSGFDLVANTYLSFEHLTLEIVRGIYRNDEETRLSLQNKELKEKVNHILKKIFLSPELIKHEGHTRLFSEFEVKRHAYNHPLETNVYNVSQDWDMVPLAWIMAHKYHKGFKSISDFLKIVAEKWEKYQKVNDKPTTINIIRGIKSGHQFKKPPKHY